MTGIPSWHIAGHWFDNCSCAVACPCTFGQAPDNGFCESVLFWHLQRGDYGDVGVGEIYSDNFDRNGSEFDRRRQV